MPRRALFLLLLSRLTCRSAGLCARPNATSSCTFPGNRAKRSTRPILVAVRLQVHFFATAHHASSGVVEQSVRISGTIGGKHVRGQGIAETVS
jgi:hypothetical protein